MSAYFDTQAQKKREAFALLRDELESSQLCVILVPASDPRHECHCIRAKIDQNPRWYSRICDRFPSSRKGKVRTRIKRREVLRVLERLASCQHSESYLVDYLESEAERILKGERIVHG